MSGGKFPYSGPSEPVVLIEALQAKGETPPQDRGKRRAQYTQKIPTTSGETSPQTTEKTRTKQVRFSAKTNVRWRPPPLTTPQSLMRGVKF